MLIIHQLLERNDDTTLAEAIVPTDGIFLGPQGGLLPEYFIELIAQSIAAINGFDARKENRPPFIGYLVGIDNFSWIDRALPGETLQVRLKKTFEFQAVTIMEGRVIGPNGLVAYGELKVWEEKE